jgi:hypothetical protein
MPVGAVRERVLDAWQDAAPELREALLEALVRTGDGALALVERAANRPAVAASLSPARQQALRQHGDARVRARAGEVLAAAASERAAVVARYAGVDALRGDFDRGRAVFAAVCAACQNTRAWNSLTKWRLARSASIGTSISASTARATSEIIGRP